MLMSVVTREFEENGLQFTPSADGNACSLPMAGSSAVYTVHVSVDDHAEQVIVLIVAPQRIPVASRLTACEYIVRVNQGLRLGGFDLDMNDGEFRFRVGIDVEGGEFVPSMLRTMFGLACTSMDAYNDGILRVVYGNIRPEDATADAVAALHLAFGHPEPVSENVDDLADDGLDIDAILRELESDSRRAEHQDADRHRRDLPGDRIAD